MAINEFQITFLTCIIVYLWTRTDAFYEYAKSLRLDGFEILKEYGKFKAKVPVPINFSDFLVGRNPSFLTKLISCPICLSIYLNLFFYVTFAMCGLESVGLFPSIYLSWALFFILEKLNTSK